MATKRKRRQDTSPAAARARQRARTTKPKGLVTRERQLSSALRELTLLKRSGVANRSQIAAAELTVKRAKRNVAAQQADATRRGRRSK